MTLASQTIQQRVNLKSMNTFGVEAVARYFVNVQTKDQLKNILLHEDFKALPKFILGEGSNVLFTQDYPGLAIHNQIKGIQVLSEDEQYVFVKVGAGESWHQFVLYCLQHDYAGIENLSLIPGTVGAAPIQNIGAYGVELKDTFFELEAMHIATGETKIFTLEECQFGYRDSVFKNAFKNQYVILSVTLRLNKIPSFHIEYGPIQETLEAMHITQLTIQAISDAVVHIRQTKLPDPKQLGNAGSFFKNPIIEEAQYDQLKKSFPGLPSYVTQQRGYVKIPAAWLIEQCDFKGKRFGDVGVHEKHALVLVNYHQGTGKALLTLARNIQETVHRKFGVMLNPEVNFI